MNVAIAGLAMLVMGQNGLSLADREARIAAAVETMSIVGVVGDFMSKEDDDIVYKMAESILGNEFASFERHATDLFNELGRRRSSDPLETLKYLHRFPAIYCSNLNNNGVRFGTFSSSKVSIHMKDASGNMVIVVDDDKAAKKYYLLDGSQHLNHEDGYAYKPGKMFYKTGKVVHVASMDKRLAVIEDSESENWRGILTEARTRAATIVDKFKADSRARINAKNAVAMPAPNPVVVPGAIAPKAPANPQADSKEAERLEAERNASNLKAKEAEKAAAAKAAAETAKRTMEQKTIKARMAIQSIAEAMGKSIKNYTRLDTDMPQGWEKQIVFSVNAIRSHLKKLEAEKAALAKSGIDKETAAALAATADAAINEGNTILRRWSDFNK